MVRSYFIVPTPAGPRSIGAGYNPKDKEVTASIQWMIETAAGQPPIHGRDTGEQLMKFCIAHEVCHYVQDIGGHLPPPDENVGLFVTDGVRYDALPREREANIVGSRMGFGIRVPGLGGVQMIQYFRRDSDLRGTGFP